jgi:ribonuclease HII
MLAMRWAIMGVPKADYTLIDGNRMPEFLDLPAQCVVGGDRKSVSIAAASILAKVTRDRIMLELHKELPIYGFDKHKGYGTKFHREMIKLYGPSWHHRKSFRGVKEYV